MSYDEILLQWLDQSAAKGLTRGANAHLVSDLVENEGSSYKWSALIIINGGHRILIKFYALRATPPARIGQEWR